MPSLRTAPNASQILPNASASFSARLSSSEMTRPGQRLAHGGDLRIVLQHLARDVERQVLAVDDAADEAQVGRRQLGVVGDVDAPHVELHVPLARRIEQIERPRRRREQQHGVGLPPLRLVVQRHRGLVERMRDGLVGLAVVLRLQLGFRPLPQRARRIDLFGLVALGELDREQDVVRVGRDHVPDFMGLEIFLRVVFEMQHDLGAARDARGLRLIGRPDVEAGAAGRGPHEGLR